MKFKHIFSLSVIVFCGYFAKAQDYHFSQYHLSPLNINPAFAGYHDHGNHRLSLKYRDQWSSILGSNSYRTGQVSYDGRICKNKNFLAFGVNAVADRVGIPEIQTNQYSGIFSYHLKISNDNYLAGAIQSGVWQIQADFNDIAFDAQYDGSVGFNLSNPNLEQFDNFKANLLDLGGGIMLYNTKENWNVGLSLFHTNPVAQFGLTQSDIQNINKLNIRFALHGSLPFKIVNRTSEKADYLIFRGWIMTQLPHWQTSFSGNLKFNFFKKSSTISHAEIGVGTRFSSNYSDGLINMDAFFLALQLNFFKDYTIGLSYDINVSELNIITQNRGGMELSMSYQFGKAPKCIKCWDF